MSLISGPMLWSLCFGPSTQNSRFHDAETIPSDDDFAGTNYGLPDGQQCVFSLNDCATSVFYSQMMNILKHSLHRNYGKLPIQSFGASKLFFSMLHVHGALHDYISQ